MKEKRESKHSKKHHKKKDDEKRRKKYNYSSSAGSSESEEWVEKKTLHNKEYSDKERDEWMSMKCLNTYTKDDVRPKREEKSKNHIDSYNPSTSVRELNPYWKDGGTGLPQTSENFRKSRKFIKPDDDDNNYYSKSSSSSSKYVDEKMTSYSKLDSFNKYKTEKNTSKSYNWKNSSETYSQNIESKSELMHEIIGKEEQSVASSNVSQKSEKSDSLYLNDEQLNKLAAKVVKAEIMGDMKLVEKLKSKLDAARNYRNENPNGGKDDESVILMSTNAAGNSRPLSNRKVGDPGSKSGKRKAETHSSGERIKFFGNDDKYTLSQMFEQEKYGTNFDDEAQLAKIAGKHKNPNDDLEDIFMDNITKCKDSAKEKEIEKQRAINQHNKLEKSLEGCEHCVDSQKMLKHLMVSCGNKVYIALPGKQSLVTGQSIISTIQHNTCTTALDEDVWEEILIYRKALTQFYNSKNMDVVFYETATRLHRFPHMVINCVPMPRDVADMAAIYFKKALLECETEWSMNKKVVDMKGKNIRKCVPKGLPYFWVDFGMDPGFAHVIEDQQLFPKTFGEEIIAGMLDLDHHLWKNPRKEYGDIQRKKVLEFIKDWKPFEPLKQ